MVPGVLASPALPLSPREGVASGRPALVSASFISSDSGMPFLPPVASSTTIVCWPSCRLVGMIEYQRRAELADRRGAEALARASFSMVSSFEVVAVEMLVDVAEHRVVFEERRRRCRRRAPTVKPV